MSKLFSLCSKLALYLFLKDFVSDSLQSHVVYQFTCVSCGACYIGETNKHFNTHVFISFGTKIPMFLNISVLLKVVGISVIFLDLRFSIMSALILNLK